jgi:hypothetical protein
LSEREWWQSDLRVRRRFMHFHLDLLLAAYLIIARLHLVLVVF